MSILTEDAMAVRVLALAHLFEQREVSSMEQSRWGLWFHCCGFLLSGHVLGPWWSRRLPFESSPQQNRKAARSSHSCSAHRSTGNQATDIPADRIGVLLVFRIGVVKAQVDPSVVLLRCSSRWLGMADVQLAVGFGWEARGFAHAFPMGSSTTICSMKCKDGVAFGGQNGVVGHGGKFIPYQGDVTHDIGFIPVVELWPWSGL